MSATPSPERKSAIVEDGIRSSVIARAACTSSNQRCVCTTRLAVNNANAARLSTMCERPRARARVPAWDPFAQSMKPGTIATTAESTPVTFDHKPMRQ